MEAKIRWLVGRMESDIPLGTHRSNQGSYDDEIKQFLLSATEGATKGLVLESVNTVSFVSNLTNPIYTISSALGYPIGGLPYIEHGPSWTEGEVSDNEDVAYLGYWVGTFVTPLIAVKLLNVISKSAVMSRAAGSVRGSQLLSRLRLPSASHVRLSAQERIQATREQLMNFLRTADKADAADDAAVVMRAPAAGQKLLSSESQRLIAQSVDDVFLGVIDNAGNVQLFRAGGPGSALPTGHSDLVRQGLVPKGAQGFSIHVSNGRVTTFVRNSVLNKTPDFNLQQPLVDKIVAEFPMTSKPVITGN